MCTWAMIIWMPPTMNITLRPYRSMTRVESMRAPRFTPPRMTAPISAALLPNPAVRNTSGAKKESTMTPVSWKNMGTATASTR